MPRLQNPTEHPLPAYDVRSGSANEVSTNKIVPAFGTVDITDEQAEQYKDHSVFRVIDDDGNVIGGAPEPTSDASVSEMKIAEGEPVAVKRGTDEAGTTTTPAKAEKRS